MARIQNQVVYPLKSPISLSNFLIGTDPDDSNRTKTYKIGDLVTFLSSLGLQNGTLKGEIVWTSGLTFLTSDLEYFINDEAFTTSSTTVTLEAADASLPRIDLITADVNGVISTISGTPAATPKEPLIEDPTQKVKLTEVRLEALAVVPTGITKTLMYDEDAGTGGGEWDVTPTVGSTGVFDLNSTADPNTGLVSIALLSSSPTGDSLSFSPGTTEDIADFTTLHFYIKTTAAFTSSSKIQVSFYNGSTEISSKVTVSPGAYSFAGNNVSSYQSIILPKDDFDFNDTQYTAIVFAFESLPSEVIYFDTFNILGGISNPPRFGSMKALADAPDSYVGKATYVPVLDANEATFELAPTSALDNIYTVDGTLTGDRVVTVPINTTLEIQGTSSDNLLLIDRASNVERSIFAARDPFGTGNKGEFFVTTTDSNANIDIVADFQAGTDSASINLFAQMGSSTITVEAETIELNGPDISMNIDNVGGVQGVNGGNLQIIGENGIEIETSSTPAEGQFLAVTGVDLFNPNRADIDWTNPVLKAIDEGNGIGYRLFDTPDANVGDIGFHAIDMGEYFSPSTTEGALATHAFIGNGDSSSIRGTAYGGYTLGGGANVILGSSVGAGALGNFNTITQAYAGMAFGVFNSIDVDNVGGGFISMGHGNSVTGEFPVGCIGLALNVNARGQMAVGVSNTTYGGSVSAADRPAFTVGIGTTTQPTGQWMPLVQQDGLNVKFNGEVVADSLTTALIDAESTGRVLLTREWHEANSFYTADGNLSGNRLVGVTGANTFEITAAATGASYYLDSSLADINAPTIDITTTTNNLGLQFTETAGVVLVNGVMDLGTLPVFTTDITAGAGGLTVGEVYQTPTGELRIKL